MRVVNIMDADLIGGGTTHPNLALMKLSAFEKARGSEVRLLLSDAPLSPLMEMFGTDQADETFVGKVFDYTPFPDYLRGRPDITLGGTGFFGADAPPLSPEVEAQFPDYSLYDPWVKLLPDSSRGELARRNYTQFSIGFMTRGCFRKCEFCVVRTYDRVQAASPLSTFLDPTRPFIRLWDDNILAYRDWQRVFAELNATGKPFVFQQGLDIRLLTKRKAEVLRDSNYWEHSYIFAFDDIRDRKVIEAKLKLWVEHSDKVLAQKHYRAKVYALVGFHENGVDDLVSAFTRIGILMEHQYLPYIMRYATWGQSPVRDFYVALAAWCNQPHRFLRYSFEEFVEHFGARSLGSGVTRRLQQQMVDLKRERPEFSTWFSMHYPAP